MHYVARALHAKMTATQYTAMGLGPSLTMAAWLLLAPRLGCGLHCPLPDAISTSNDITRYVSLCAVCSHNEAAVRWNRTVGDHLKYYNFYIRYECYDTEGNVVKSDRGSDDEDDCPWIGTTHPIANSNKNLSFGIVSIGREFSNDTTCSFDLTYRVSVIGGNARYGIKQSFCTVGGGCEGDECRIDRVCTFSNGTQGAEEGLCTECFCSEGYSGPACTNTDECGSNGCDTNADCIDTDGSYWCQCLSGFTGDGYNCTDINECENATCVDNAICINTEGNYSCECKSGFTGDGYNYCTDINECAGNHTCDTNADCIDTDGSYWCQCLSGFTGDGYNCTDINECENATCVDNAICINTEGNYSCECKSGFTGDGYNCKDLDECHNGSLQCPKGSHCQNLPGSYRCECKKGLVMDGDTCKEPTNPVVIVVIPVSLLVSTLIVILLLSLLILKIFRPKAITFDDLTVKELDPFYSPKLWGHSSMSIHSEYECLYTVTPSDSKEKIEHLLENETADENETETDSITASHSIIDLKNVLPEKPRDNETLQPPSCASAKKDLLSCPYIDEQSLGDWGTVKNPQRVSGDCYNASENCTVSAVDPLGEQGDDDSCSTENSPSTFEHSSHSHVVIPSGYVELAQGVNSFEPCQPSVFQSAPNQEEKKGNGVDGNKGKKGEKSNGDNKHSSIISNSDQKIGYSLSAGVQNEEESLSKSNDDEQSHSTYIFTEGCDMTGFTSFDEPTFTSSDPNYIHNSVYRPATIEEKTEDTQEEREKEGSAEDHQDYSENTGQNGGYVYSAGVESLSKSEGCDVTAFTDTSSDTSYIHNSVYRPATIEEKTEDTQEERENEGSAEDYQDYSNNTGQNGGYVYSAGVENEEESLLKSDYDHNTYLFTI